MPSKNRNIRNALLALLAAVLAAPTGLGQVRPKSLKKSEVKSDTSKPKTTRTYKGSARASHASNGLLIVLTNPGASVSVDGKPAGVADAQGQLVRELALGRTYLVEVLGGDEYTPFSRRVSLDKKQVLVDADLTSKYGVLRISPAIDRVRILVDGTPASSVSLDPATNQLIVPRIAPGQHQIKIEHPDYATVEQRFAIEAGGEYLWTPQLQRAAGDLLLATEPGVKVYLDSRFVAEVLSDGTLKIGDVSAGEHTIQLSKAGFEDRTEKVTVEVRKTTKVAAKLAPRVSSTEFFDDFGGGNGQWTNASAGAMVDRNKLVINTLLSPILTKKNFRDFKMTFYLTLGNGGGAAWVVRASDARNFYRFCLSGPTGQYPNRFVFDVVRDGKADPNRSRSLPLPIRLEASGHYTIEVLVHGDTIEHRIRSEDSKTAGELGVMKPLDNFRDEENAYAFGAVGFCTVGSETFAVTDVFVIPQN